MIKKEKQIILEQSISFRLPDYEYQSIRAEAEKRGVTISEVMRQVSADFKQKNN